MVVNTDTDANRNNNLGINQFISDFRSFLKDTIGFAVFGSCSAPKWITLLTYKNSFGIGMKINPPSKDKHKNEGGCPVMTIGLIIISI